ncbi:MAG TPA: serine/threonine-protein kinase [Ktedonobacterales bacterium]|nr:serine/threonine-protein kinase [Ktedonobacterales bacterium]
MNLSTRYCAHCGAANPTDLPLCLACDQPLSEADFLATDLPARPLIMGRYRLLARLGTGGFGAVYRAEDTTLGRRMVAIKEMTRSGLKPTERAEATEAFQREAYLLAGLNHPNLPAIYDHFQEGGRWYLVMEFIEGQTLEAFLAQVPARRLPVNVALKIGLQLTNVLGYLHTQQPPIIFRDLKPPNVMLTATTHAYLIDFGIARLFKPGQAKDTLIIGTPGYLAPEGYGKAQTTPRSDIYSLGATLHHVLSGTDPTDRPFSFAPLQLPVPAPLQALIASMVQMDERDRPATMAEVQERLQQIEQGSAFAPPTTVLTMPGPAAPRPATEAAAEPPRFVSVAGTPGLPTLPASQGRIVVSRRSVAIGLGAVLAGGVFWALVHNSSAPQPPASVAPTSAPTFAETSVATPTPPPTPPPTPIASGTTVYHIYRGNNQPVLALAWSPLDGASIASASSDPTTQIWNATSLRVLVAHSGAATRLAWSPNGQYLATSGSPDEEILIWQAANGGNLLSYPIQAQDNLPALAWSSNSRLLAASDDPGVIHIWDALNGNQLINFGGSTNGVLALAWHPDGVRILSGSGNPNNTVYLWDTQAGAMLASYAGHLGGVSTLAWSPDGQFFASGSLDNTVRVWSINNGTPITVYSGHASLVSSVVWSPDGKRIASASSDTTVHLWDAATGGNVFIYRGHTAPVTSVDWSPKNNRVASGSIDTTVQIWEPL